MFDRFINWMKQYPTLHVFCLTFIFFGLVCGWCILIAPFAVYDKFKEDFTPYFSGITDIWNTRK